MMLTSKELFDRLEAAFGPSQGWPGNTVTIMATAVMVQNTAWTAVVRAMARFPQELTAEYLLALPVEELMDYIRPCGFMKRKAETIRTVMEWYGRYDFDETKVEAVPQERLRQELLALKGIGEETADVILLYAFHKPVFVLDTYTRRMLKRLGGTMQTDAERRAWFLMGIPHTAKMYDDYHWLLLEHGKHYCKKRPLCDECPLGDACAKNMDEEGTRK